MALITVKNPQGITFTVDESQWASVYQPAGWTKVDGSSSSNTSNTSSNTNTGSTPITSWYLSNWNTTGSGSWSNQPVLTINGTQYKFNTPQEYIDKLNWLKSQGATGNIDTFVSQFNSAIPEFKNTTSGQSQTSQINSLYQKYFGRNATSQETSFWQTQPITTLENQLLTDYKKASGLSSYDGSPIQPGNQKTNNQLSGTSGQTGTQPGTQNTGYVYGNDVLDKKANNAAVNYLYNKYFGRDATQPELDNWGEKGGADTTVRALEDFLKQEQIKYGYDAGGDTAFNLPEDITSSVDYQNLTNDQKAMLDLMWTMATAKDEESRKVAEDAFNQAKGLVDPTTKVLFDFAKLQVQSQFGLTKDQINEQLTQNQETLNEIGKLMQDATLEEQQTLKALARDFENNISTLQEQVSESGLTYSSKRSDLERYISEQNTDIMQSTQRSYDTKIRNLETSKNQAQRQTDLVRKAGEEQLKAIAQGAEQALGTSEFNKLGLTGLSGNKINSVGTNYAGSIEDQRRQQILQLSQIIQNYSNPSQIQDLYQ